MFKLRISMEARNSTENITWVNKILLAIFVDSVRKFGGGGGGGLGIEGGYLFFEAFYTPNQRTLKQTLPHLCRANSQSN